MVIGKNLDRSDRGITEVLSQHLPGGTEEHHEKPESGQTVFRPKFEPSLECYLQTQ
jgi:hypothetical protein